MNKQNQLDDKLFIDQEIIKIESLFQQGNIDRVNQELLKFRALYQDLQTLEEKDFQYIRAYKNKLMRCLSDQYHGIRLEIGIAQKLLDNNIRFTMPDPPDFLLEFENAKIKIECTSRHLSAKKDFEHVVLGFKTAFETKSRYGFVDSSSALFIDASNLSFNDVRLFADHSSKTKSFLQAELEKTNFGNVTVFSWILNVEMERYENNYNRIDSKTISIYLKRFLDQLWPYGNLKTGKFLAPIIG